MRFRPITCTERDKLVNEANVIALGGNTDPGVYHCTIWGFKGRDADDYVVRDEVWYGADERPRACEHWVPTHD